MNRDAGQAFPLYITAVAALLLLALAFFAVGRAGAAKNGTQTAADAAALAAAQDYRDQLRTGFLTTVLRAAGPDGKGGDGKGGDGKGADWAGWLAGRGADRERACRAAAAYAATNSAQPDVTCEEGEAPGSFRVRVTSARTVGPSVVPGTENRHATASAEAVVTPRCAPRAAAPAGDAAKPAPPLTLTCDGEDVTVDPARPGTLVPAAELFTVRLTD
ncbi:pilus assembly protein TadG-related protein [Streptomyces sp. NPDC053048]|uniref:pilus assembly protein TadG-related protein n=1 Tax=Streptomyces sp. NPDC053048 TaxID=3365694 RepID=UPI0037CFA47A